MHLVWPSDKGQTSVATLGRGTSYSTFAPTGFPVSTIASTADIKTIGQAMMAPDDIELEDPPEIADSYRWNRRHAPWRTFSLLSCVLIFGYATDRAGGFCFFRQAPPYAI